MVTLARNFYIAETPVHTAFNVRVTREQLEHFHVTLAAVSLSTGSSEQVRRSRLFPIFLF